MPYGAFAHAIGKSFVRVLHPARGRFVVLINRRNAELVSDALSAASLVPEAEHEVLVNGHPASPIS